MDVEQLTKKIKVEPGGEFCISEASSSYKEKLKYVSVIAKPMASRKLAKKLFKLVKKAKKHKTTLILGVKDVLQTIKKGNKGLVIFAGDITPIEVICHVPAVCEEYDVPYCYVPSKEDLGLATNFKSPVIAAFVFSHENYSDLYSHCAEEVGTLPMPF